IAAGKGAIGERFVVAALSVGALGKTDQVEHGPVDMIFVGRSRGRRAGGHVGVHHDVLSCDCQSYGWTHGLGVSRGAARLRSHWRPATDQGYDQVGAPASHSMVMKRRRRSMSATVRML